jgi:hypothetical protein
MEDRRKEHAELLQQISISITELKERTLSEEEKGYVLMAMKREARKEKFREAVIQKTTISLIWSAIVGTGILVWTGLKDHLK